MPVRGFTWNDEYRKKYYSSDKVQEHLEKFTEMSMQPKTPATKAKMSQAKLGRKFSEEHKHNMSEAHKFRQALRKEIQTQQPNLASADVWKQVRERQES